MSARTVLDEVYEKATQLTVAEREQLRAWLGGHMTEADSFEEESEEITEEDLREKLRSCEEYYGMSSDEFVRRYDARDPEVLKLDHAGGWRMIYDWWEQKRDETSQG